MTSFTVNGFLKNVEKWQSENLFMLYGNEHFYIDFLLQKITEQNFTSQADRDLNHHKFYGTENTISEILSACMSYPMLAKKKLVVVKEFDRIKLSKNEAESLIKYLEHPQATTRLVLTADRLDKNQVYRQILKSGITVECKNLNSGELYNWVNQRYIHADIEVEKESITFLIENIGNDLLRLNQEVEKSIDYLGRGKKLTLELISELTGFNREVNIFNFQKVLGARKLNDSLKIGLQLLEQQNALEGILAMLFRFFLRVITIKQLKELNESKAAIIQRLHEKEFVLRDAFASEQNFSNQELIMIFNKLEEADLAGKTSERSKESIITMLCYYICYSQKNNLN
jgi:DNA polymerase-3 subunit delta